MQKYLPILSFALTLTLSLSLFGCGSHSGSSGPTSSDAKAANLFYGLKKATAQEIHEALPGTQGKLLLIEFNSQYCLDCKKMAPVLKEILPQYPKIQIHAFDMMKDREKSPAIFKIFQPTTVPVMIFVTRKGEILNVLYNYQPPEVLKKALDELMKSEKHGKKHHQKGHRDVGQMGRVLHHMNRQAAHPHQSHHKAH